MVEVPCKERSAYEPRCSWDLLQPFRQNVEFGLCHHTVDQIAVLGDAAAAWQPASFAQHRKLHHSAEAIEQVADHPSSADQEHETSE